MSTSISLKQFLAVSGMLFVTVIWGASFILVKWTIAGINVYYFLFLRFLVAFAILAVLFRRKISGARRETIKASFLLAIFMFGAYASQTEGLLWTSASNSALITGLYLVIIPIFSVLFFGIKARALSIAGALIAFFGLYLLTQYSWTGFNIGDGVTLICALSCAGHILLTGKYTQRHDVVTLVVFQFLFMAILCGLIALLKSGYTIQIPKIGIITIIVTAIFATAIAFIVQTASQRIVDPTRTGIILAFEAVFGVFFAYWWGNETLTTTSLVGAFLMVLGMVISEIHPLVKYLVRD